MFFFSTTTLSNGVQDVPMQLPPEWGVTGNRSNILAAACELNEAEQPFVGKASVQVLNIAPGDNSVVVRLNILWDYPINVRLAIVVWP